MAKRPPPPSKLQKSLSESCGGNGDFLWPTSGNSGRGTLATPASGMQAASPGGVAQKTLGEAEPATAHKAKMATTGDGEPATPCEAELATPGDGGPRPPTCCSSRPSNSDSSGPSGTELRKGAPGQEGGSGSSTFPSCSVAVAPDFPAAQRLLLDLTPPRAMTGGHPWAVT
ncbi:UNVERIFIED_CONTAM: hypothetical protein FKN15_074766 [Acipenser sinensis]